MESIFYSIRANFEAAGQSPRPLHSQRLAQPDQKASETKKRAKKEKKSAATAATAAATTTRRHSPYLRHRRIRHGVEGPRQAGGELVEDHGLRRHGRPLLLAVVAVVHADADHLVGRRHRGEQLHLALGDAEATGVDGAVATKKKKKEENYRIVWESQIKSSKHLKN